MPDYVIKTLSRLQHTPKVSPRYSLHAHIPIQYATKNTRQYATATDTSPHLTPLEKTYIQSVTGIHLYYGHAIDHTIITALNELSEQAQPTQNTKAKYQLLIEYVHTFPNAYTRYYTGDMILHIDRDDAYFVGLKECRRVAGYFHLSDHLIIAEHPKLNGAIFVERKTLRHVLSSAAKTEVAGIFHNARIGIPIRNLLHALQHPQPPTPIKIDNSIATGFIHNSIHQKRSKSWDMRYHWLRNPQTKKQFRFYWDKGTNNNADYFTNHYVQGLT